MKRLILLVFIGAISTIHTVAEEKTESFAQVTTIRRSTVSMPTKDEQHPASPAKPPSANTSSQRLTSDSDSLELTGYWAGTPLSGETELCVGIQNIQTTTIKAFRAKLYKINDFDEGIEVADIEFTSESKYLPAKGEVESHHLLKQGETMFYNHIEGVINFSGFSDRPSPSFLMGTSKESLAEGRYFLKVSKIVK